MEATEKPDFDGMYGKFKNDLDDYSIWFSTRL
jgi:hypothetical protein